jgi:hypothetical protein
VTDVLETVGPRSGTAPFIYTLTEVGTVDIQSVFASYNGTSASGDFLASLTVRSQNGAIIARAFAKDAVTAGDTANVTFAPFLRDGTAAAAAGYATVQDEGVALTQRTTLDFVGAGVTATDDSGALRTVVTIPGTAAPSADYAAQVLAEASLLSYWPLDEASGNAIDYGPSARNLTPHATPTYAQPGPFAVDATTAILFDSADGPTLSLLDRFDDANGGTSPYKFNGTAAYTLEAMVAPTTLPTLVGPMLSNGDFQGVGSLGSLTLGTFLDGRLLTYRAGQSLTGNVLPLGAWSHVAVTYDGAVLRLYLTVKNSGTGTITVGRTGAETIDGAASNVSMAVAKDAREFTSDGTGWWITASYL